MFVGIIKCLFYNDLPQTTINKAINDLRKRLNARVLAFWIFFAYYSELGSRV